MFKLSSSPKALCQALFLVAAIMFQTLALPGRGVAFANALDPTAKTAPGNPLSATPAPQKAVAQPQRTPVPSAPQAASIVATLTDNVTAATKIAPGANINYTATITNNGAVSPADDATSLNFSAPLDANTTLVGGSVHASPIAFNDTYNWVGNTQLDTSARALPAVTANDVAVNAPAGTDTFTVTAIAGGATALSGTVTLASPSGAFTYTPPLGRPNIADGPSVNDSFTYTITNNADPALTSTGTVTIALTGRVWYLQAGAAGDGRSNTPSSSPAAMSTAADKSTDFFYVFSNAGSLNGPFSVDAGQQLLGQGVNLVVNAITLFTAAAPTPTTTNTAGNCVALAGAPGNNTLSGFNIGNCTGGTAITGANVGTLNVSTMSITTNGGGLDLTGVGTPTVSVVLGGLTSTGGTKNVNLVGLNGTFTLASGALSGATNNAFDVSGGNAGITYSGTISNSGARQVSIVSKTSGTVALSGAVSGTGTGIFLNANGTSIINFTGGVVLSTGANDAFTATSSGTTTVTGASNSLTTTTGQALKVTSTTIAGTGLTFATISSNGGANNGITLDTTGANAGLTVTGTGGTCTTATPTCTGGTIVNKTGGDGSLTSGIGIYLNSTINPSFTRMSIQGHQNHGIRGGNVTGFTLDNSLVGTSGINGTSNTADVDPTGFGGENSIRFYNLLGSATISNSTIDQGFSKTIGVANDTGSLNRLTISNCTVRESLATATASDSLFMASTANAIVNFTINGASQFSATRQFHIDTTATGTSTMDIIINGGNAFSNSIAPVGAGGGMNLQGGGTDSLVTFNIDGNSFRQGSAAAPPALTVGRCMTAGMVSGAGKFDGKFTNNTVGVTGVNFSGGGNGADGIGIFASGDRAATTRGTGTTDSRFLIQNNVFKHYGQTAIQISAVQGGAANASVLDATVIGNTMNEPGSAAGGAFAAIWVNAGALAADTNRVDVGIGSQSVAANKNTMVDSDPNNATDVFLDKNSCAGCASVLNLYRNGSGAAAGQSEAIDAQIITDDNNGGLNLLAGWTNGSGPTIGTPAGLPPQPSLVFEPPVLAQVPVGSQPETVSSIQTAGRAWEVVGDLLALVQFASEHGDGSSASTPVVASVATTAAPNYRESIGNIMHHAFSTLSGAAHTVDSMITPTVYAQDSVPNAPTSGENVTLNTIATFPAGGKSITIKYSATVNAPPLAKQVSTQGTVSGSNFASVLTDDPEPAGAANPTVTLVDTLMTWNGVTSTDWNTITNWTQPAGGTQYAPGVSNPAINDVVIPNVGQQPNISATDIGIFSLNIANGRTLTIGAARTLTIGGSPGGDLTVDGIISGGFLNLGTGTHVINNAGGTGSIVGGNQATVLSGSTVTLNNNLQMGSLTVNAGGNMTIASKTLSLARAGAALNIPGGATFTTTGSTVVLNGGVAQTIAGITYNNLTINNSIGAHVTGVTLQGNATVNGVLTLTSSDLDTTGAFTLTMPAAATSGPASGATDVVGNVKRTGFVSGVSTLSFGNPFNTIKINSGAAPADINMLIAKNAPATYAGAVLRSYTITPNGANGPATLRLHYRQTELNGNSETPTVDFNLRRLNTGNGQWQAVVPTNRNVGVPEDNWLENNVVASFSEWTMDSLAPTAAGAAVTGRIVDSNGNPVEGAVVNLSGGQARKFITDANGNYRFDNVVAGEFYTVTPSRANFNFNPFNRSFTQVGNQTEAVFTGTSMGDHRNPLDTPEYFVRQQYVDILGREPEEAGFNYWSDQILACGADAECGNARRRDVAASFFISEEFQASGSFIYDVYAGTLGRRPAFGEYTNDRQQVVGGATLDAAKSAFAQNFVQRADFMNRYQTATTPDAFVDAILRSVQPTGVDLSSERDNLIGTYNLYTDLVASRGAVVKALADNATFKQSQYNGSFVLTEYFAYLRREAEPEGYAFWLNVLTSLEGRDPAIYRGMVCSFVTSAEYQNRFSVVVSHSNGECGQ